MPLALSLFLALSFFGSQTRADVGEFPKTASSLSTSSVFSVVIDSVLSFCFLRTILIQRPLSSLPFFPLPMLGTNLHRCNYIFFSFTFSFFCFYFHSFYFYNIAFRNDTAFSSQYVDLRFHGVARRHVPFCSSAYATKGNTNFALQDPRIICILVFCVKQHSRPGEGSLRFDSVFVVLSSRN